MEREKYSAAKGLTKPTSTVKKIKIEPDFLVDLIDLARIGYSSTRCPGGRLIHPGYMCGICGNDPSLLYDANGKEVYQRKAGERVFGKCGSPKKEEVTKLDLYEKAIHVLPAE